MPEQRDVVEMIRQQHSTIRELFAKVTNAAPGERAEAFEPLVRLLAVHETAEEEVVYPAVSGLDASAAAIVKERKAEEDTAKKALANLEGLDAASPKFMMAFTEFHQDVDQHARNEETHVLPLVEKMEADRRRTMGTLFTAAEAIAPTHAHRLAPESAVGNMLVGPFVSMVDRVRDLIRDARR